MLTTAKIESRLIEEPVRGHSAAFALIRNPMQLSQQGLRLNLIQKL